MKVLITGANGFLGKNLVSQFIAAGHEVVALIRSAPPISWNSQKHIHVLTCNLDQDQLPLLNGLNIDLAIHLAAPTKPCRTIPDNDLLIGTQKFLQALHVAKIRHLIAVSSLSVLDYEHIAPLSVITEECVVSTQYPRMGQYGALKAKQERLIAEFSLFDQSNTCIILRPGMIYTAKHLSDAHGGVFKNAFQLLITHSGKVPLVELNTVSQAITRLSTAKVNPGLEYFHLVDNGLPSQNEYLSELMKRHLISKRGIFIDWKRLLCLSYLIFPIASFFARTRHLPEFLLPQAYSARVKPFLYSNAKAIKAFGWQPMEFIATNQTNEISLKIVSE